jgi:predicted transposase/invertase (TIGR01784 family)
MIIADKDEREKIIKNGGDKNMKDFSEILSNMSEDEYYKGWCTREEDNAFMDYQTGLENGKEEGIKEGRKEGMKEGIEEGTISIAKKLLEMNMKIEDISKATGLSISEIEKIK